MLYATENRSIDCPYCGESIDIIIDTSIEEQDYVEDCQVCCRPITMQISLTQGFSNESGAETETEIVVTAKHQDEY
ncbi:MAG: CPXCG motif-containing cysteine-rich protein [Pseudomonadota bacterium]